MVTQRRYPTNYGVNEGWINPEGVLNVEDDVCARVPAPAVPCRIKLYVNTFNFNIPVGSTITKITLGLKASLTPFKTENFVNFYMQKTATYMITNNTIGICFESVYVTADFTSYLPSVDDLNNETFTAWVEASIVLLSSSCFADACYIEVTYTPAAVGVPLGDGLSLTVAMRKVLKDMQQGVKPCLTPRKLL